ncbi:hypothetical protein DdX_20951 [Ditylenchus destructor]|uniref:Uncharacterized protein n=1 Tax=Ditylenchus destructor TaxID=166010 RepID=A0AAD4MFR1_9BILA|nr:hypothetical protein DdX_20951 [Ditylenchus destructor]
MMRTIFLCTAMLYRFFGVCYMDIANYYVYLETCQDRFCYAVRGINISYNTNSQAVSLLCATPTPLDEEETLPRAIAKGATTYEDVKQLMNVDFSVVQPCNDTNPLLLEDDRGGSHAVAISVFYQDFGPDGPQNGFTRGNMFIHGVIINFQSNGSVSILTPVWANHPERTNLTFNETSSHCSVYEDADKRACVCKENNAREYCLHLDYKQFDPSRTDKNSSTNKIEYHYYHIYGRLTVNNLHYYYYFEMYTDKLFQYYMYVQRYSASTLREAGGNQSISLCMSYNGTALEVEYNWQRNMCKIVTIKNANQNFTLFAKFHDAEWHSLLWFDYLRWTKSYIPGYCSYDEQILDDVVHPFAICMRRNVTEKFYKNNTQGGLTSTTLRITTDYSESSDSVNEESLSTVPSTLIPTLLDQDCIKEDLSRIAGMRSTEDEMTSVMSLDSSHKEKETHLT